MWFDGLFFLRRYTWFWGLILMAFSAGTARAQQGRGIVMSQNPEASGKRKKALIIGISEYDSPRFKLNYADSDAILFKNLLVYSGEVKEDEIIWLANKDATETMIYDGLDALVSNADSGDRIWIYFAGHGDLVQKKNLRDQGYLLARNASETRNYRAGGAVSNLELSDKIDQLNADRHARVILVLDACHSGFQLLDGSQETIQRIGQNTDQTLRLLSSGSDQFSYELNHLKHGAFTWYLIKGLSGLADNPPDNKITPAELKKYLQAEVSFATDGKQKPIVSVLDSTTALMALSPDVKKMLQGRLHISGVDTKYEARRGTGSAETEKDTLSPGDLQNIAAFNQNLQKGNYYGSESSCMADYENALKQKSPGFVTRQMKVLLSDVLLTRAQSVLNELLRGKSEKQPVADFIQALSDYRAVELLMSASDPRRISVEMNKRYLQAYIIYLNEDYTQFDSAFALVNEAISLDPGAAYTHQLLALLYKYRQDYPNAVTSAKKAIELIPNWTYATNTLGNIYYDQGQYQKSIQLHMGTLKSDSLYSNSWNNIGNAWLTMGGYNRAEYFYKLGLQLDPKTPGVELHNLGVVYEYRGLPKISFNYYINAAKFYQFRDVQNLINIGKYYNQVRGDFDSALWYFRQAVNVSPNHSKALCELADFYRNMSTDTTFYQMADSLYNKSIRVNPFYSWAFAGKGWLENKRNHPKIAQMWFDKAIEQNPSQSYPYLYKANFTDHNDSAILLSSKALSLDSFDYYVWKRYISFQKKSNPDLEEVLYKNTEKYFPENPEIWMKLGDFQYGRNDFKGAETYYNRCLQSDSMYAPAWASAAYVKLENEHIWEAISIYKKSMQNEPEKYNYRDFYTYGSDLAFKKENAAEMYQYLKTLWMADSANPAYLKDLAQTALLAERETKFWQNQVLKSTDQNILKLKALYAFADKDYAKSLLFCDAWIQQVFTADKWLKAALLQASGNTQAAKNLAAELKNNHMEPVYIYKGKLSNYPIQIQTIINELHTKP